MKHLMIALALSAGVLSGSAYANSHKEAPDMAAAAASATLGKQQSKMTTCNAEAGDKKGDERKAFMKTCLSAKKQTPQQAKMTKCNAEAKGKTGDERKTFMKTCLSS
jgi:hypothetical protein